MRWVLAVVALWPGLAGAQGLQSNCQALAEAGPRVQLAALTPPQAETLRIRYLTHSEFALQTPGGVLAVTDYNGVLGNAEVVPDVVTMNHAHESHFTDTPDPRIQVLLKGWPTEGRAAFFDVQLGDLHIRNVTSDTRGPFGEGAMRNGNSIFLFEAAGLCVAHLGHLHQVPNRVQYAGIGRVDVVMLPVDGGYTMTQETMIEVAQGLHAQVVIPMHWFSDRSLAEFLAKMDGTWVIDDRKGPQLDVSLASLPARRTVVVLTPALFP
jgi:L-ascorbate metabolism protein UlaG (beta-lactamase superfamily)